MPARTLSIPVDDGAIRAWFVEPIIQPDTPLPAVILLPEIYNINSWIREVAERYAALGYVALVPDLFWRQEPGVDLEYNPQDQQRGRALSAGLDRTLAVQDLAATAAWLRSRHGAGAVASVGFCLGGELAYLGAAQGVLDAAVAYYPTRMGDHGGAGKTIDVPTLVHIGHLDFRTPPELVDGLRKDLAGKPHAEVHVYAEADHGFGRFGHPPFHPASAALAEQRTHALLGRLVNGTLTSGDIAVHQRSTGEPA
ncbi:dienelactone hydrolase family protein [Cupriavidus basilensis]|uniref:dienelactone hydrolase family protein n=1 Tax=Cupriavidus basilensis TaxID=68895 RepID=UPI0007511409|nr:dienelactone hydrolase family protein [Cupriavidus basilensis]